jgi:ribosomal protein L11 methyltransferase
MSGRPAKKSVAAKPSREAPRYSWRKLSAAKWSDAWLERLAFLGPQRAMVIEFPGARTVRVEAHGVTRREADDLRKMFGGKVTEAKWLTAVPVEIRPPIRVRGRLLVVSTAEEFREHTEGAPRQAVVLIPAGMAFGTGEHATTATCLRFLADVSRELAGQDWEALDLGTGSGILAIAARKLGARRVEAGDFDPHAVRTAKENVRANAVRGVSVKRFDVRQWEPERTWDVVISNLFSGLLVETASKIAEVAAPGGRLIFSGVLRVQEAEVLAAFKKAGLKIDRVVRKGKWVSGLASRPL